MSELTQGQKLAKQALQLIKENPSHWRQDRWHCGTTHSFAGFVEILSKGGDVFQSYSSLETYGCAQCALGIEREFAEIIFAGDLKLSELDGLIAAFCGEIFIDETILKDWRYRVAIASNPGATPEQLDLLLGDNCSDVLMAVARNLNLTSDQLDQLFESKQPRSKDAGL